MFLINLVIILNFLGYHFNFVEILIFINFFNLSRSKRLCFKDIYINEYDSNKAPEREKKESKPNMNWVDCHWEEENNYNRACPVCNCSDWESFFRKNLRIICPNNRSKWNTKSKPIANDTRYDNWICYISTCYSIIFKKGN